MKLKALLSLFLFSLNLVYAQSNLFPIKSDKITFDGKLINQDGLNAKAQEGTLHFFDAIIGDRESVKFKVDQNGNFNFDFEIYHAIFGKTHFQFGMRRIPVFLKPGEHYKVEINLKNNEIAFLDGTGVLNQEIARIQKQMKERFAAEHQAFQSKHHSANDSSKGFEKHILKRSEQWTYSFLKEYTKTNNISEEALSIFINHAKFKTASASFAIVFDLQQNTRIISEDIPKNYLIDLHNEYPTNVIDGYITAAYSKYLMQVGLTLNTPKAPNLQQKIDFFRSFNLFTEDELELIRKIYSGNKAFKNTAEYKKFFNDDNAMKIDRLNKKFAVNNLFSAVRQFPESIGRDLIISQFVYRKYFKNNFVNPSKEEWIYLQKMITYRPVLNKLKQIAAEHSQQQSSVANPTMESLINKYLEPHKGKVIYIDFWATWCGPCRREEPHAAKLHKEFQNEDVVFLNLCCQSKEANWNDYIDQKNPSGEHFLLSNNEFRLFAELYNLKGFPTYVLIDKEGKVKTTDAYWPSDSRRVIRQITKLLK